MVKLVGYLNPNCRTLTLWKKPPDGELPDESTRMMRTFEEEFLEKHDVLSPCDIVEITIDPDAETAEKKFELKLIFSYRYAKEEDFKTIVLVPDLDLKGIDNEN